MEETSPMRPVPRQPLTQEMIAFYAAERADIPSQPFRTMKLEEFDDIWRSGIPSILERLPSENEDERNGTHGNICADRDQLREFMEAEKEDVKQLADAVASFRKECDIANQLCDKKPLYDFVAGVWYRLLRDGGTSRNAEAMSALVRAALEGLGKIMKNANIQAARNERQAREDCLPQTNSQIVRFPGRVTCDDIERFAQRPRTARPFQFPKESNLVEFGRKTGEGCEFRGILFLLLLSGRHILKNAGFLVPWGYRTQGPEGDVGHDRLMEVAEHVLIMREVFHVLRPPGFRNNSMHNPANEAICLRQVFEALGLSVARDSMPDKYAKKKKWCQRSAELAQELRDLYSIEWKKHIEKIQAFRNRMRWISNSSRTSSTDDRPTGIRRHSRPKTKGSITAPERKNIGSDLLRTAKAKARELAKQWLEKNLVCVHVISRLSKRWKAWKRFQRRFRAGVHPSPENPSSEDLPGESVPSEDLSGESVPSEDLSGESAPLEDDPSQPSSSSEPESQTSLTTAMTNIRDSDLGSAASRQSAIEAMCHYADQRGHKAWYDRFQSPHLDVPEDVQAEDDVSDSDAPVEGMTFGMMAEDIDGEQSLGEFPAMLDLDDLDDTEFLSQPSQKRPRTMHQDGKRCTSAKCWTCSCAAA